MSFAIPDLIIESIIRDGIENVKNRPEILDDVFADLTKAYANRKYGVDELQRIKNLLTGVNNTEIAVVHSYHEAAMKAPCISIQLGSDLENARYAHLDDFEGQISEEETDAAVIAERTKVTNLLPSSYDPITGMIKVADTVDLSNVNARFIYTDGSGEEFLIKGGISNDVGNKFFFIAKNSTVDISQPGEIKSFLSTVETTVRGTLDDVQIMIGIHTKEALLTKYLYILVKYFLKSRRADLIRRCFQVSKLSGSDFTRDLRYEGDMIFTRFITISGTIEESWRSDQVDLIDEITIDATPVDCPGD